MFPSGRLLEFDFPVAESLEMDDVLVVRLEVPRGEKMNRNVFGVNREDGRILWQVPERRLVYEDSPYTGIRRERESVALFNWDGLELRIDPRTGEVLEELLGRWSPSPGGRSIGYGWPGTVPVRYARVDPILDPWARANGLSVVTSYKDSEVRSIDLVGAGGARFQLWLDPPGESSRIGVHVWDYRRRRADYEVHVDDLTGCLDEALRAATEWAGAELARR